MTSPRRSHGFNTIVAYITPHRGVLLIIVSLLLASGLVAVSLPWIAGLLTGSILAGDSAATPPAVLLALWLGMMLAHALLNFCSQYSIGKTAQEITAALRNRLYEHMQMLPVSYHQQRQRGETLSLLYSDVGAISTFVTGSLVQMLPALVTFSGALLAMVWLAPAIALLCLLCLPPYFVLMKFVGRGMRPLSRAWIDANSRMYSVMDENLALLPAIKAFTREAQELQRFARSNGELLQVSRRQLLLQSALGPCAAMVGSLGLVLILWLGVGHIQSGELTPAELVTLLLYAAMLLSPLGTMSGVYGQLQTTRGAAERIIDFLNAQPEPSDRGKQSLGKISGAIRFQAVHFAYPGRPPVLNGLDLEICAGETIAITGTNGSGKSTIAHLLMRFEDPGAGAIFIDDTNTVDVSIASIRSQIGLVAQQVLLVNGTVAENIAFGLTGAGSDAIEAAARSAHAHGFISQLPQGYDTVIGDQGIRLSGGQRQRISLARTLLKDPPILILDEATAMFDPAGEQAFIEECSQLLQAKTVILITHRPASLSLANRIIVLENGRTAGAPAYRRTA